MSKIEVNTVAPQCGTTLTLGESGDTVTLGSGASQSGFGRQGSVNWQTSIKTATFTAASGEGYFCNTSGGAFTVNLPSSPSVGDIVAIKDYGSSFAANNLTIGRGGSNMNGSASDSARSTDNESLTLVYADATKGWLAVEEGTGFVGEAFIEATGGTITSTPTCKIHTFTGPGTFSVTKVASCSANNVVSHLVVAGGGSGGNAKDGLNGAAGGAGAGGYREVKSPVTPYTASPLDGYPSAPNRVTVTATDFPITVGAGASNRSDDGPGSAGSNSIFSTVTAAGGGAGGRGSPGPDLNGGSGGGSSCNGSAGTGNQPPVTPPQGNPGGTIANPGTPTMVSAGGGGAGATGGNGSPGGPAGPGGAGVTSSINGTPTARAGGGGGGGNNGETGGGTGGSGGGGAGGDFPLNPGTAGTANTGGGGGASASGPGSATSGAGGSGIVIIRYKYQ